MNKRNYQKELEKCIRENEEAGKLPRLLLHSCCAPCSSYVLEYLSEFFSVTVFYYNPNIYPEEEYGKRVEEQKRLIQAMDVKHPVSFLEGTFFPGDFYRAVEGHEGDREGGERCFLCYRLRLEETARKASEGNYDFFTTTLSVSPLKNAEKLNEIGEELGKKYGISYLNSDFKKKNGYKRSVELSSVYGLYRQDYCGCVFSKRERESVGKEQAASEGGKSNLS